MSKVKCAVCHGATRCPYEKGLGAAHGQVTTETKLGLELGAPLPLCLQEQFGSSTAKLALGSDSWL